MQKVDVHISDVVSPSCQPEILLRQSEKVKDGHPECFVPVEDFPSMTYREVLGKMDKKAHTLFQMTLFALIHKIGKEVIRKHICILVSQK